MYLCKNCFNIFDTLLQVSKPKKNKMFQLCPKCKSENLILLNSLTSDEKKQLFREIKLNKILKYI